jgi:hypothetical protein
MIMKVQASGILILIACILTGCGKSMKDVAGVYETSEIKKPFNTHTYDSTTWVLDLAESGTFTLTKKKFRKFIEDKKYQPRPMDGMEESGAWSLDGGRITITIKPFVPLLLEETRDEPYVVTIPLAVQSTGDLVSGANDASGGNSVEGEFSPDLYLLNTAYDLKGLRFKRVE